MGGNLVARIERSTGTRATATSQALLTALRQLDARRIVLITPYCQEINDAEVAFFSAFGLEVIHEVGFPPPDGESSAAADPQQWYRRTLSLRRTDADAYVLSCTNIRVLPILERLERDLDAPVISSNQSMLWHCLRSAGVADAIPGYGRLLRS